MSQPVPIPPENEIEIILKPGEPVELIFESPGAPPPHRRPQADLGGALRRRLGSGAWGPRLFILALVVYLATRLVGIVEFPIYFFCDEAQNPVNAADLIGHGLQDNKGTLLPTFFNNDGKYSLGTSVYLQVLPVMLFGKSEWITRAVSALLTLLAAYWLGSILRRSFSVEVYWAAPLLLALVPAWFILSRAAFECSVMVTFYTGCLYFYLRYRLEDPRYLYPSLVLAGLAFYSYFPGQVVVVLTGALLLLSDLPYHWRQRRHILLGTGLLALLALPLVRFLLAHPDEYANRLAIYHSVFTLPLPLLGQIGLYLGNYLSGLNPAYLFLPNNLDEPIYVMQGYGHLLWWMLPLAGLGLVNLMRRWRAPQSRVILLALLAAPAGGATVAIHITRQLSIVAPIVVLEGIGLTALLAWVSRRLPRLGVAPPRWAAFAGLAAAAFIMLANSLSAGPTWFSDYTLGGMQYGARQVFAAAQEYQVQKPGRPVFISPNFTFQSEVLRRFFLPDSNSIRMGTPDAALGHYQPQVEQATYVLIPSDLKTVVASNKFKTVKVERVLPYPDGRDGFYFVRLAYRDDIQAVFQADEAERRRLVEDRLVLDGQPLVVRHSRLDVGPIVHILDGDPATLVRSDSINPLLVELDFVPPRLLNGLSLRIGSEQVRVTARLYGPDQVLLGEFTQVFPPAQVIRPVELGFGKSTSAASLHIEILDVDAPDNGIVHLWEIALK